MQCQLTVIILSIRLLKEPKEGRKTTVKLSKDLGLISSLVTWEDVPGEVVACKLPVWFLPQQRTCIAGQAHKLHKQEISPSLSGLCSVMRYSLRMGFSCEGLAICQDLLGFQVFTELTGAKSHVFLSTARLPVCPSRSVNMD